MASRTHWIFAKLVVALAVGCSQKAELNYGPTVEGARYSLAAEPEGATGVTALREAAQNDESIVVVGRIGGGIKPWIEGRAAFVLVDASFQPNCKEEACAEGCTCHAEELADCSVMVKFTDENGRVVAVDAREFLGVRDQDMVVIQGRTKRDEGGNLTVVANGIYVRR